MHVTLCNVIRDCDEIQDCAVIQVKGYVKISVLTLGLPKFTYRDLHADEQRAVK